MYRVFQVEGGYQIFWCPSEWQKVPLTKPRTYSTRQAAYRRAKKLNDRLKEAQKQIDTHGAIIV